MKTYKIQANASGTRSITVSEEHLATIRKYSLLRDLVGSSGVVDEAVLDKLKLNTRSILESEDGTNKELLNLCLDVFYNNNMKAFGLNQLMALNARVEKELAEAANEVNEPTDE